MILPYWLREMRAARSNRNSSSQSINHIGRVVLRWPILDVRLGSAKASASRMRLHLESKCISRASCRIWVIFLDDFPRWFSQLAVCTGHETTAFSTPPSPLQSHLAYPSEECREFELAQLDSNNDSTAYDGQSKRELYLWKLKKAKASSMKVRENLQPMVIQGEKSPVWA